ncbi:hypothetical protein NCS57_00644900 [Fusarium keratoplasticum]|uniref:Uncharacterized protein n=1 Tax=Fusarium keratoplasticum TaxID=1328300 RepID=A0ACC0R4J7_9HYPO|nr:hypothetical protein NCS57_00644900 [Fusarium keratoplasticum]KAI8671691.1 hypothetical protein NCS57_00644900 [Fusarium keratoplasticum]
MTDACQAGPNNCGDQTIKGEKFCEKRALIPSRLMKQRLTNPDAECTDPDCHVRFEPYNLRYSQIGGDRWFCPDHACTEGGCYKRRRDSVTLFCAAHAKENQCSKPGCEEIRVPDGQLCKQHTCDEPGCLLEVYPQGQNGQMCSQHQPCGYAGCRRFTPLDGNGHPEKLCAYHHLCRAPGDPCDGIVDGNSDYCPQHKCGVMECNRCRDNLRVPENRWCTPHTCITEGCQQCIDNTNDPNSRHCSMHTCSWRGCSGEARMNSRFCSDHVCRRRRCERSRLEGSHFCPSHSCRNRGCPNAARRQGGCCVEHGGGRDEFSESDSESSHRRRRHRHDQLRRDDHHRGPRRVSPGHRRPRRQEEEEQEDDGYYTVSGRNSRNASPGPRWAPRRDGFEPNVPWWDGFQANVPRRFRNAREAEEMERAFQQMDRHVRDRNQRWF